MYCFDKGKRLLKKGQFDHVFKQAKKVVIPEFIMLYRTNTLDHARLGLALSKKIIPKAHDRNRIKRLLRETFRVKFLPNVDVVILARKGASYEETSITIAKLDKAWDKLVTACGN